MPEIFIHIHKCNDFVKNRQGSISGKKHTLSAGLFETENVFYHLT